MSEITLPSWAQSIKTIFRAETTSQYLLYGNVNDYVVHKTNEQIKLLSLRQYLSDVLFAPFDIVLTYDRGQGIVVNHGAEHFQSFLQLIDKYNKTNFSEFYSDEFAANSLSTPGLLPRTPLQAFDLIDRLIRGITASAKNNNYKGAKSIAIIIDYAQFLFPRGESLHLTNEIGSLLIKMLSWAQDPSIVPSNVITCCISENLLDLHQYLVDSSFNAKVKIDLPTKQEVHDFISILIAKEPNFVKMCELDISILTEKLCGLRRLNIENTILQAVRNAIPITSKYLAQIRKETIEKEASGKIDFIESNKTLDNVAGHNEAKKWLREDAQLIRKGVVNAIPMGYLVTGRIGTGKTYLVQCFAGECGIPFVELKNFRDKWVGTTEGNLEKIFSILHGLGQVVVFVDEADQAAGKRDSGSGDSGLSGRIYGMLAKEMANTENRGKIIWIFATSRPDLLEIDLKRQGRLDVHIPLFPPVEKEEQRELFFSMAKKLKAPITFEELPELPFTEPISGNEIEGLIVRAIREHALQDQTEKLSFSKVLANCIDNFIPSKHTSRLELMDLLAVKECTDKRFLPPRFAALNQDQIDKRIAKLELNHL